MATQGRLTARIHLLAFLVVGVILVLAGGPSLAEAQQPSGIFSGLTGRVEVLPKGQTAWQLARLGMRVFEGDQVRAFPGANGELRLPDGSTVLVAENTRFAVTKLDYTPQNQMRSAFFHLAVGKIRGIVARAAVALVQARQNNFAISTPTAVAAVRGTTVYATVVDGVTTFFVLDGVAIIRDVVTGQSVEVRPGQVTTVVPGQAPSTPASPTPAQQAAIQSVQQAATAGTAAILTAGSITVIGPADIINQLQLPGVTPPTGGGGFPLAEIREGRPLPITREASPF